MLEWCLSHPWLTFWITFMALVVIDNIFANLCRLCNNVLRVILAKKNTKIEEVEDKV